MKKLIATAFIASAGLALASSAQAMPVAPLDQAETPAHWSTAPGREHDDQRV